MGQEQWTAVDQYVTESLELSDAVLDASIAANRESGLPAIDVSPPLGKLLYLLARIQGARRILEIGTLGGYSSIWLARALPEGGRLTTLEANELHAAVARANLRRAGLEGVVDLRVGLAVDSLERLQAEGAGPFDLIFIDADKANNPNYLKWGVALSRPGSIVVCDNVVRGGAVTEAGARDADVMGIRAFFAEVARNPRLSGTAIQTVGFKGYDGFAIVLVS
jgi:predicted O-methyltransferase YrrM